MNLIIFGFKICLKILEQVFGKLHLYTYCFCIYYVAMFSLVGS